MLLLAIKRYAKKPYFYALFMVFICCSSLAKQTAFNKKEHDDSYLFHYAWLDANNQEHSLDFHLNKKSLLNQFRDFRSYKQNTAQRYMDTRFKRKIRKEHFDGVKIRFENQDGRVHVVLTGDDPQKVRLARAKVNILRDESYQEYLEKHFYQSFTSAGGQKGLKPDHVRFAQKAAVSLKPLKPVILDKVQIKSIREVTNFSLGFIQSIPYSTLESRITASGAGFNHPLKLLWENQGDCDSKVTLTAAILRSLMPRVKIALIFLDGHALIGIKASPKGDDVTITHNNTVYILAEPTGPAMYSLGKVASSSEQAIYQGQYTVEEFNAPVLIPRKSSDKANDTPQEEEADEIHDSEKTEQTETDS